MFLEYKSAENGKVSKVQAGNSGWRRHVLIVTVSSVDYEMEVKIELDGPVGFYTMEVTASS